MSERYQRADKKGKSRILDEFIETTHFNWSYASWLLNHHGQRVMFRPGIVLEGDARRRKRPPRTPAYGEQVVQALTKVRELLDFISSRRLAPRETSAHPCAQRLAFPLHLLRAPISPCQTGEVPERPLVHFRLV